MKITWFFKKKSLNERVTKSVIKSAYKRRSPEIESLRKYDRGEKTITPRNLKNLVRSI